MSVSGALPNEVLTNVLGYLGLRALASVSLVSRSWQILAFARLYHTVFLALPSHLALLAQRVSDEQDDKQQLSLRTSIKKLVLDENYKDFGDEDYILENDLDHLSNILPKLSRLESFFWDLSFIPRDSDVLHLLQTACPSLTSVHFDVKEEPDTLNPYDDAFIQLFNFTNLAEFSLSIRWLHGGFDEDQAAPLVSLLRACPTLRSLTLNIQDYSGSDFEWSPSELLSTLDADTPHTFPNLHTFRALGDANPDWSAFFISPDTHPLRQFFARHPGLHTIGLGWIWESGYYQEIDPADMSALFPALRHLDAPSFLCAPIVASSIAEQLESLAILDTMYESTGPNLATVAQASRTLPNLKKIALHAEKDGPIEVEQIKSLVRNAPGLEELEFRLSLDEPDEMIPLLRLVPKLRTLSVYPAALDGVKENLGVGVWQECVPALVEVCPLLVHLNDLNMEGAERCWEVNRAPDGKASVVRAV